MAEAARKRECRKGCHCRSLICYAGTAFGSFFVIRLLKFVCLAVFGGALAFGLSACGVKGPLDLPPSAVVDATVAAEPGAPPPPVQAGYVVPGAPGAVGQVTGPQRTSAAVANAPAAKQRSILDWLVD
jgi:predicted small lipoprotein YifL